MKISKVSKFFILSLIQGTSLVATIEGAKVILSSLDPLKIFNLEIPSYLLLGFGIQLFIFWLFLFGKHTLKSSLTLWILILVYTFLSIYTSFFSFYKGFSNQELTERTPALEQSEKITLLIQSSPIYNQEMRRYPSLLNEISRNDTQLNKICQSCDDPKYNDLRNKLKTLEDEKGKLLRIERFKSYIEAQKSNFNGIKGSDIHERNKATISDFTDIISNQVQEQQRKSQNFFLFPLIKLQEGYPSAIAALILASIIDGTAVLIGVNHRKTNETGVKKAREKLTLVTRNLAQGSKNFLPYLIEEIGHTILKIIESFAGLIHGLVFGLFSGIQRIFQIFIPRNAHTILIGGKRRDFIGFLWDSTEDFPSKNYTINRDKLIRNSQEYESFQRGYKILLKRMCSLNWLERKNDISYEIIEYKKFERWCLKEENKKIDKDRHNPSSANRFYTVINLPKQQSIWQKLFKL